MPTKAELDATFGVLTGKMDALNTLSGVVGGIGENGSSEIQIRNTALQAQKDALEEELSSARKETEKYKKAFQEKIFFKPVPVAGPLSTLQDFALAMFAVGWVLLSAVVVGAGIFQPGGTWKRGVILAVLMFILSVIIQSLMTSYL